MTTPSLDKTTATGSTIEGGVREVATPSFNSGVASGVVSGIARAGTGVLDNIVGGAENRKIIEQSPGAVVSGIKGLLSNNSISNVAGGVIAGATRAVESSIDGMVGGAENRQLIQQAGSKIYGGVSDVVSGRQTISGILNRLSSPSPSVIAGPVGKVDSVGGTIAGAIGLKGGGGTSMTIKPGEGSQWGELSKYLIGNIYACDAQGNPIAGEKSVKGPVTDANIEGTANWQSPFESSGPESKAPALMAMLQSGSLVPVLNAIQQSTGNKDGFVNDWLKNGAEDAAKLAKDLEGKAGITKLNSRQVFAGMPPIKISITMHFRAIEDPQKEVVEPYEQLWALFAPRHLAPGGFLANAVNTAGSGGSFLKAMFPSDAPHMVRFIYAGCIFPPLVIEHLSSPLDGPMDKNGRPISRSVQITMSTLTALDKNDVRGLFTSKG